MTVIKPVASKILECLRPKANPSTSTLCLSKQSSYQQANKQWATRTVAHRRCPNKLLARAPSLLTPHYRCYSSSSREIGYKIVNATAEPLGMAWYDFSPERQIQEHLRRTGDAKWGWVIYRCTYKPELDRFWQAYKRLVSEGARTRVAASDAPGIAERLDWRFVEDRALEGASREELKRRWREWAREEKPGDENEDDDLGSRHTYFVQVDEEALRSMISEPGDPDSPTARFGGFLPGDHVKLVAGWVDGIPPGEEVNEYGDVEDAEDWMKMRPYMVAPYFYVELEADEEAWRAHYAPPPNGVSSW
ncbi:hypothetical protein PG985_013973 [Apiospora marii]|uniref:Uncharacterized protein n=1 Tax=Apiospora marii TaxID=335849 RepID=A0ABR1R6B6_9PEZI